jgi:hypothetical protein
VDIDGTSGGVTIDASAGSAAVLTAGTTGHGLQVEGAGSGDGLSIIAGDTGHGVQITAGNTSGKGLYIYANNGVGIDVSALNAAAVSLFNDGTTTAAVWINSDNGDGLYINAEASGKVALKLLGDTSATPIDPDTLNAIADALLKRDLSGMTGEAARSPLNALRLLRNKWDIAAGTLTVYKEDDASSAWTGTVTANAAASPITTVDPS